VRHPEVGLALILPGVCVSNRCWFYIDADVLTAVAGLVILLLMVWCQWRKRKVEKLEVQRLVEDIIS